MPSRSWRKRERRRSERLSQATADENQIFFGGSGGLPSCDDLRLIRQAIRQRWPTPPAVQVAILNALDKIINDDSQSDRLRLTIAAIFAEIGPSLR